MEKKPISTSTSHTHTHTHTHTRIDKKHTYSHSLVNRDMKAEITMVYQHILTVMSKVKSMGHVK
jgi:hypothetical protein